jgi:copper chaperone
MHRYSVPSMTCGHCAGTIDHAVKSVDPSAVVNIDLKAKTVSIRSEAPATRLSEAIRSAGYEAVAAAQ